MDYKFNGTVFTSGTPVTVTTTLADNSAILFPDTNIIINRPYHIAVYCGATDMSVEGIVKFSEKNNNTAVVLADSFNGVPCYAVLYGTDDNEPHKFQLNCEGFNKDDEVEIILTPLF